MLITPEIIFPLTNILSLSNYRNRGHEDQLENSKPEVEISGESVESGEGTVDTTETAIAIN